MSLNQASRGLPFAYKTTNPATSSHDLCHPRVELNSFSPNVSADAIFVIESKAIEGFLSGKEVPKPWRREVELGSQRKGKEKAKVRESGAVFWKHQSIKENTKTNPLPKRTLSWRNITQRKWILPLWQCATLLHSFSTKEKTIWNLVQLDKGEGVFSGMFLFWLIILATHVFILVDSIGNPWNATYNPGKINTKSFHTKDHLASKLKFGS